MTLPNRPSAEDATPGQLRGGIIRLGLSLLILAGLVVPLFRELPLGQTTRTALLAWALVGAALYWLYAGQGVRPMLLLQLAIFSAAAALLSMKIGLVGIGIHRLSILRRVARALLIAGAVTVIVNLVMMLVSLVRRGRTQIRLVVLVPLAAMGLASRAPAQSVPAPLLSITAGEMRYRLAETRDGAILGFRLGSPFVPLGQRHWMIEAATSYGWFRSDSGQRRHVFLPELELQLHTGTGPVQGYVGGGGGLGIVKVDSTYSTNVAAIASAGLRLRVSRRVGLVTELRLRSYDLFRGTTKELTFGLFQRLE